MDRMRVLKRNGSYEEVSFDKILNRIRALSQGKEFEHHLKVDETLVAQKVVQEIYDGVKTSDLDELASQIAIAMYSRDPAFKVLAGRIVISNHQKNTSDSFWEKIQRLYRYESDGQSKPLIAEYLYEYVSRHKDRIESVIDYTKDFKYDFFGFKTLERNYLYQLDRVIVERPQDMLMRVSLAIYRDDIEEALLNYSLMSDHYFTHATPTLFNAGSPREQFASCFLLTMKDDSVSGIYDTLKDCALISKHAGGIGLAVHDIRASGSYIAGTNGYSNGLVPMLRVFNDTARYIDQGGNKRNGSFAMYLEPWHADVLDFLELKKNHGNELERARDLFYALWIPDLFMKRVKADGTWSLMCPHQCPGLSNCHSQTFVDLYEGYESQGRFLSQVPARDIWHAILSSQIETGTPYLLYKDACNRKSNQQNLGTIRSSNLCTEIVEYTSPGETAVCNLASISLKSFVKFPTFIDTVILYSKDNCPDCLSAKRLLRKRGIPFEERSLVTAIARQALYRDIDRDEDEVVDTMPQLYTQVGDGPKYLGGYDALKELLRPTFDWDGLADIAGHLTRNLNQIIDANYYPIGEAQTSNRSHRPIGLGVQGLANVFFDFEYPYDSPEARALNKDIFETIYYGSMKASMELSRDRAPFMQALRKARSETPHDMTRDISILETQLQPVNEELQRDSHLGSYASFLGSPLSQGHFQFDLWDTEGTRGSSKCSGKYDWDTLRSHVMEHGVRNSLLVAPMPTASTAQILGNYECFEPILSNVYTRRVLAGEYMVINEYLVKDLQCMGLWSTDMKNKIIEHEGSVQSLDIPSEIKNLYKTVWELKQKVLIDMATDRGHFICQSQSLNLFLESPDISTLTSMHFYAFQQGLKTGLYYLRTRPSSTALKFSLEVSGSPEVCESCSG